MRLLLRLLGAPAFADADAGRVDPALLLRCLEHHRVWPLLHPAELDRAGLPKPLAQTIAIRRLAARAEAMRLAEELAGQADRCAAAGIPMLALKGPALALQLRGDAAARQSRDLDLLVAPGDLAAARALLEADGYQVRTRDPAVQSLAEERDHELTLRHPERGIMIELHRRPCAGEDPAGLRFDRLWARRQETELGATLPLPLAIAHAAHHGCGHLWTRLFWLDDIAVARRRFEDEDGWGAVRAEAAGLGWQRPLGVAELLAHRLLGAPAPSRDALAERTVGRLGMILVAPPLRDREAIYAMGLPAFLRWDLALRPGWRAKLAALRHHLRPTADDAAFMTLPPALALFYPAVRLFRILARAVSPLPGDRPGGKADRSRRPAAPR